MRYWEVLPVHDYLQPAATFIFHYRSSSKLQMHNHDDSPPMANDCLGMLRSMLGPTPVVSELGPPPYNLPASSLADRLEDLAASENTR